MAAIPGGWLALCLVAKVLAQTPAAANLSVGEEAKKQEKWVAAVSAYESARTAARGAGDTQSEGLALAGLTESEFRLDHFDAAIARHRECIELTAKTGDKATMAVCLRWAGYSFYRKGLSKENLEVAERLLALYRELQDRAGTASTLNNIGNLWRYLGDRTKALDYLIQAANEFQAMGNNRSRAVVMNNMGGIHTDLGEYARGTKLSHQALALLPDDKDSAEYRYAAYTNIALSHHYRGDNREALRLMQKARTEAVRSGSDWATAESLQNIASIHEAQGSHAVAIATYRRLLTLSFKIQDRSSTADIRMKLGEALLAARRAAEAIPIFRAAIEDARVITVPLVEAQCRRGLAVALVSQTAAKAAEVEFERAAQLQRSAKDAVGLAQTLTELSRLRLRQGRRQDALTEARTAIETLGSIEAPEAYWRAQHALGRAWEALGDRAQAAGAYENAIAAIESVRRRVAGPPAALPAYLEGRLAPYQSRVAIALASGAAEEALLFSEQSRSRALGDALRQGVTDLTGSLNAAEREAQQRLRQRLANLNLQLAVKPDEASRRAQRDEARREWEALESQLYAAHPETAFAAGATPSLRAGEPAAIAASAGAAIVSYFVTPESTTAFVLKPGRRAVRVFSIGLRGAVLSAKAREFHRQLASHDLAYGGLAQELYRGLLKPLEAELAGERAVVILPDGPLWDVAFHALQPAQGRFLIERHAIAYAPSLTVLRETMRLTAERRRIPAPKPLLALGNPAGHPALPEAERQARAIASLYGPAAGSVLVGERASAARFRAEAAAHRVLHLASHAVLDNGDPLYSHALLARTASDAGLLTARDLMQLRLRAELMVLSACETARGAAVAGEGSMGLSWAAAVAGAPATLASLWRVESASTSDLMVTFHRHYLDLRKARDPLAAASAVRQAMLGLAQGGRFAHPFYWAGFVLMGSPL